MSLSKDTTEPETKRANQSESDENEDRLSGLPDCLILHILSFVKCRDAVRTCILSKRWKCIWKRMSILVLHASDFGTIKMFTRFVTRLLFLRDGSTALRALDFKHDGVIESPFLKQVLKYAVSQNIQRLGIDVQSDDQLLPGISSRVFSCQALTSLRLSVRSKNYSDEKIIFPKSLNLPALTRLHISNIVFCASRGSDRAEPFSTLNRLDYLFIGPYTLRDARFLCVSSTTVSSLTFQSCCCSSKIVLSTPNLCSFAFSGVTCHDLSGSCLSSIEQVYIDANTLYLSSEPPLILLNILKELTNVRSMTVTVNTLQIKLPSLGNLKSLRVKMEPLSRAVIESLGPFNTRIAQKTMQNSPTIPRGILDFLLQNSRSSKVVIMK
ncbi:hypothetical protein RIF29_12021 [Crotalaria pallida]|uniref:F-box domain-containing protein n=1 Tax=Crotalaria pallida TaxID=3830 RepID=A0AAN9IMR1_CROPI